MSQLLGSEGSETLVPLPNPVQIVGYDVRNIEILMTSGRVLNLNSSLRFRPP